MLGMIVGILFGVYVVAAVLNVVGVIIGAVFSGVGALLGGIFSGIGALVSGAFSGRGIVLGVVLGLAWYYLRKKNPAKQEAVSTVDGQAVETKIVEEPVQYHYMGRNE